MLLSTGRRAGARHEGVVRLLAGEDEGPRAAGADAEDAVQPRSELCLQVRVRNLYFQSGSIGAVLECEDLLMSETAAACPWAEPMEE